VGSGVNWNGRALAFGGTVTTGLNAIITAPNVCAPATTADMFVIKQVINNDGGTKVAADFTMNVTATNPLLASFAGVESPGTFITLDAGAYTIDESDMSGYTKTLSADCSGTIAAGETKTCIITNDDDAPIASGSSSGGSSSSTIRPRISVKKVPSPTSLADGAGTVLYTYTVTNPGLLDLDNVSVTDDKCSAMNFVSGDDDNNLELDTKETWIYSCSTFLRQTTTNIVTATGYGHERLATDTDTATVVVAMTPRPTVAGVSTTTFTPSFPNTGIGPDSDYSIANIIVRTFGVITFLSLLYIASRKYRLV